MHEEPGLPGKNNYRQWLEHLPCYLFGQVFLLNTGGIELKKQNHIKKSHQIKKALSENH